jgi:hypothetical protein
VSSDGSCLDLHSPELGTIWGPSRVQVGRERVASLVDGLKIRVQVPLCRGQRSVSRDLPENVQGNPRVRHPGEPGVPEVDTVTDVEASLSVGVHPIGCSVSELRQKQLGAAGVEVVIGDMRQLVLEGSGQVPVPVQLYPRRKRCRHRQPTRLLAGSSRHITP